MSEFNKVRDFMRAMQQEVPDVPKIPDNQVLQLRINLIEEEVAELLNVLYTMRNRYNKMDHATKLQALVALADAVADSNYVINGTAAACGLDGEAVFNIVHAANLSKLTGSVRDDGKRMKPPGWIPPEPQITNLITNAWANRVAPPTEQAHGVPWEGPNV